MAAVMMVVVMAMVRLVATVRTGAVRDRSYDGSCGQDGECGQNCNGELH